MANDNTGKNAVALGYFDGLHIAHMRVISEVLNKRIDGLTPCLLLFDRHPQEVLSSVKVSRILQEEKRDELLTLLDIKVFRKSFLQIKNMAPEEFVREILVKELNAGFISCGYNYRFGVNGSGSVSTLKSLCRDYGIEVCVCPEMKNNGETISSTAIRKYVAAGNIKRANEMLGRKFCFSSTVFDGDHRGRTLGAPTINQYLPKYLIVPKFAVYASTATVDGKEWPAVTNIGNRPTFDGSNARSETFILGYHGDLYNREIEIKLYDFIRSEKKFEGFDELKAQIALDVKTAQNVNDNAVNAKYSLKKKS